MSDKFLCDFCGTEISNDSEFCTKCGTIFIDDVSCFNHSDDDAKGVCAICHQAYCKKCGLRVNGIFLCNQHSDYEIYEGMARVYGTLVREKILYYKSILEDNSLHPFIYDKTDSPFSEGIGNRILIKGNNLSEIKILVPCAEVLHAEKIIDELEQSNIELS